jgi:hypothetical protein
MTIRKGHDWGSIARPMSFVPTVSSDGELRTVVESSRRNAAPIPTLGLIGGDLMRTLGGSGDVARLRSGEPVPHLPIDVVHVIADDSREAWFVAHLVARRGWWTGQLVAAMNAQYMGTWDVSPRGHPNDGLLDIVTVSAQMSVQQRWIARRRIAVGAHLPHPLISVRQCATTNIAFDRDTPLWLDGQRWGSARSLRLDVEPDSFVACV